MVQYKSAQARSLFICLWIVKYYWNWDSAVDLSSDFFSPTLAHCHKQLCFKPISCLKQSARFKQNWQYHI